MTMTPERWRRVDELYHAALAKAVEGRATFLADACAGDEGLRREVESLLAQSALALDRICIGRIGAA
jgi:serine/threonine-protein kinase